MERRKYGRKKIRWKIYIKHISGAVCMNVSKGKIYNFLSFWVRSFVSTSYMHFTDRWPESRDLVEPMKIFTKTTSFHYLALYQLNLCRIIRCERKNWKMKLFILRKKMLWKKHLHEQKNQNQLCNSLPRFNKIEKEIEWMKKYLCIHSYFKRNYTYPLKFHNCPQSVRK